MVTALPRTVSKRPEVHGTGVIAGAVRSRRHKDLTVHDVTRSHQYQVEEVIKIAHDLKILEAEFPFSSIQVLVDAEVDPHQDGNPTLSIIVSFGDFVGGELLINGLPHSTRQMPVKFDGSVEHSIAPFTGRRISLAFYLHKDYRSLSPVDLAFLNSVGFHIPSENVATAATEAQGATSERRHMIVELGLGVWPCCPHESVNVVSHFSTSYRATPLSARLLVCRPLTNCLPPNSWSRQNFARPFWPSSLHISC